MPGTRLLLLFGGTSSEHEISIRSAQSVLDALDRDRFEPTLVGIGRDRVWRKGPVGQPLSEIVAHGERVTDLRSLEPQVAFPILHGQNGEDGTMQGLFEILGWPYVGSGVLASALCMDKVAQKQLIAAAAPDIPVAGWRYVDGRTLADMNQCQAQAQKLGDALGYPCFVKPASLGSSVGVHKATSAESLAAALADAARYDNRIIVEQGIDAREIELAVLGNGGPDTLVSAPGEIVLPPGVWYDYDTKYHKDVASLEIPASLPSRVARQLSDLALAAFRATDCRGLARVDFLLDRATETPYLNELNTMPGFTSISMYPKLMAHRGVGYRDLITRLCELGQQAHAERASLCSDRGAS